MTWEKFYWQFTERLLSDQRMMLNKASSYHRSIYSDCCCELIHREKTVMIQLQQRMHQYLFGPDKNQKFMRILSESIHWPRCVPLKFHLLISSVNYAVAPTFSFSASLYSLWNRRQEQNNLSIYYQFWCHRFNCFQKQTFAISKNNNAGPPLRLSGVRGDCALC